MPLRTRKKPSAVRSPVMNGPVALVHVAGDQRGGVRVGAGDDQRRHAADVGGEPGGVQRPDVLAGRDEHLPAEVAALLLGRELVLPVHAGRARRDHGLHQLERVEHAAEARPPRRPRSAPASAAARDSPSDSAQVIWSARSSALLIRRTTCGTELAGYRLWSG